MKTKDIRNEQIGFILTLSFSAILVMGLGCKKQAASEPVPTPPISKQQSSQEAKPAPASETKTVPTPATNSAIKALVFRNIRSWNREQDFEDVLSAVRLDFDVRSSGEMEETDLSPYSFIIIPGAQWQANFYQDYE